MMLAKLWGDGNCSCDVKKETEQGSPELRKKAGLKIGPGVSKVSKCWPVSPLKLQRNRSSGEERSQRRKLRGNGHSTEGLG